MARTGTEAFVDLGKHCSWAECNQLDFLPFTCDGCRRDFCAEHRSYESHDCSKAHPKNRVVILCDLCSASMETAEDLEKHQENSRECEENRKQKQKKRCSVGGCREILTFSNTIACKSCGMKTCLKHRFPRDHACGACAVAAAATSRVRVDKGQALRVH
ncbi:hypothetical protein AMTRI_Chr12g274900 [Amborella trichopoda]|uniref:AN1-type domain-containing protein n=1 Tax=Amborella trichopoda TaxID=13333 RepID=W1PI31_AMBTC|nr:zinc finger AN1 domain-containing stress-associated protein 17 [Amborella trichopoda]ERN07379.1 hypothetical protein AMTR_s00019p00239070 [Amborella trichopoda]|eukprot:XP_006845704.1 zinc finger AN1 domain-containing stress-associated protein 17 [Amborella trichopoda]